MPGRKAFERYLWFHRKLKENRFPNLAHLMEQCEISYRQAQREISNFKLWFSAPIRFSRENNGYYYTEPGFELPASWIGEDEMISLVLAKRLAAAVPDPERKKVINQLFEKLYRQFDFPVADLEKKISLKNTCYYRVEPAIFSEVLKALHPGNKISISYHSVHTHETTERTICPLHLVQYMGNWHLLAYCEDKKGMRMFTLSRIKRLVLLPNDPISEELKRTNLKEKIDGTHGIFIANGVYKVKLKFKSEMIDFVKEQVWFPGQKMTENKNGELFLEFPVSDLREILREILCFGPSVEVLEPGELRDLIKQKITGMYSMYFEE